MSKRLAVSERSSRFPRFVVPQTVFFLKPPSWRLAQKVSTHRLKCFLVCRWKPPVLPNVCLITGVYPGKARITKIQKSMYSFRTDIFIKKAPTAIFQNTVPRLFSNIFLSIISKKLFLIILNIRYPQRILPTLLM